MKLSEFIKEAQNFIDNEWDLKISYMDFNWYELVTFEKDWDYVQVT